MKVAAASWFSVAILAATAWAAPVDPEQHPLASAAHPEVPVAAAVAAPSKAQSSPASSENLITAVWNALVGEKGGQKEGLGQACFCSSNSICCNTPSGLDCTHGLCGI
ncbi:hypothetical protein ColLi_07665 [Colletotrichum liriopes]|uniref:Hydrophobin n=1 Tax=Colletotrichum liriopes TaxID=708192 RepID=A0AA37GQS3_9PEZI|nr:hypothetical protein ColLi_07665 [Colletotrichum liriopes]